MKARFYGFFVLRVAFIAFFLLTSLYCLLSYIPFTHEAVIKGRLIPVLYQFAEWNHLLYWLAIGIIVPVILYEGPAGHRRSFVYLLVLAAAGVVALVVKPLASTEGRLPSYLWSIAALAPIAGLARVDWQKCCPSAVWGARNADEQRS